MSALQIKNDRKRGQNGPKNIQNRSKNVKKRSKSIENQSKSIEKRIADSSSIWTRRGLFALFSRQVSRFGTDVII